MNVPAAKRSLVTTSWDDGDPRDLRVAEVLAQSGLRGTFYVPIEWERRPILQQTDLQRLVEMGMEIGAHTYSHVDALSITPDELRRELRESKDVLEQHIGRTVPAFCYPKGRFRRHLQAILLDEGYRTARTTQSLRCELEFDPLRMPVTCQLFPHPRSRLLSHAIKEGNGRGLLNWYNDLGMTADVEQIIRRAVEFVARRGGVVHVWGHSWELDQHDLWPLLSKFISIVNEFPALQPVTNSEVLAEDVI